MQQVIEAKIRKYNRHSKIEIIENWGDTEGIYPLLKEEVLNEDSSLKDRIIFQYAGNLGRVQGLIELLHIIKKVKNNRLVFHFVGEGAVKNKMLEYVEENKLKNVFFGGAYSREDQLQVLNKADVSFVSLAPKMFGLGVPSKTYNILAAGKPILYVGEKNSEIDLLLREENIGYSFQHFEEQKILDFFNSFDETSVQELEIMKQKARKVAEEKFSEEIILNKFYYII